MEVYGASKVRSILMGLHLVVITLTLYGCGANFNSIYRTFDVTKNDSITIDAKQRVVIVGTVDGKRVVCAEPSPDALSVLSATLSATGSYSEKVALQLAGSRSESASNIGLRTQTIQLLRDAMFRLCEGYLGNALSSQDFSRLQRRYQNIMLGLLAIEQLTEAVSPKQVVLTSSAATDFKRLASEPEEQEKTEDAKEKLKAGEATHDDASKVKAQTGAQGVFGSAAREASLSQEAVQKLAETVEQIVKDVAYADYTQETCLNRLIDFAGTPTGSSSPSFTAQSSNIPPSFKVAIEFCQELLSKQKQELILDKQKLQKQVK